MEKKIRFTLGFLTATLPVRIKWNSIFKRYSERVWASDLFLPAKLTFLIQSYRWTVMNMKEIKKYCFPESLWKWTSGWASDNHSDEQDNKISLGEEQ